MPISLIEHIRMMILRIRIAGQEFVPDQSQAELLKRIVAVAATRESDSIANIGMNILYVWVESDQRSSLIVSEERDVLLISDPAKLHCGITGSWERLQQTIERLLQAFV